MSAIIVLPFLILHRNEIPLFCSLFYSASLTQHNASVIHAYCCVLSVAVPCYCQVEFHYLDAPQFYTLKFFYLLSFNFNSSTTVF